MACMASAWPLRRLWRHLECIGLVTAQKCIAALSLAALCASVLFLLRKS